MDCSVEKGLSPFGEPAPKASSPPWACTLHPLTGDNQTFHPQTAVVRCEHTCAQPGSGGSRSSCSSRQCALQGRWWHREAVPARPHWLGFPLAQPHLRTRSQAEPGLPACSTSKALLSSQVKRLCAAGAALAQEHASSWICDPALSVLSVSAPKDSADPTAFQYLIHTLHKGRWAFSFSR